MKLSVFSIALLLSACGYAQTFGLIQMTSMGPVIRLQPFFGSEDRTSNYHGQFGLQEPQVRDPEFQPYSSFIFENNVYWTGRYLNKKYAQSERSKNQKSSGD